MNHPLPCIILSSPCFMYALQIKDDAHRQPSPSNSAIAPSSIYTVPQPPAARPRCSRDFQVAKQQTQISRYVEPSPPSSPHVILHSRVHPHERTFASRATSRISLAVPYAGYRETRSALAIRFPWAGATSVPSAARIR